jgi:agmatinase
LNLDGLPAWGGLLSDDPEPDVVLAGIPYDGSAVYRRGAAQAPAALRRLSALMPPVTERGTSLKGLRLKDVGDLDLGPDVEQGWPAVAERLAAIPPEALLTVLGGDHCVEVPVIAAQLQRYPELAVLSIDAHPDLCDISRGSAWSCGCALRRALEVSGLPPGRLVLAGARDFDPEELEFIDAGGVRVLGAAQLAADPSSAGAEVAATVGSRPLHITFDIDALDPAFAPGTEIPAAGGPSTRTALDFMAAVGSRCTLVGLDVVEVAPPLDNGDITSLAALKIIFELWGMAWKRPT